MNAINTMNIIFIITLSVVQGFYIDSGEIEIKDHIGNVVINGQNIEQFLKKNGEDTYDNSFEENSDESYENNFLNKVRKPIFKKPIIEQQKLKILQKPTILQKPIPKTETYTEIKTNIYTETKQDSNIKNNPITLPLNNLPNSSYLGKIQKILFIFCIIITILN